MPTSNPVSSLVSQWSKAFQAPITPAEPFTAWVPALVLPRVYISQFLPVVARTLILFTRLDIDTCRSFLYPPPSTFTMRVSTFIVALATTLAVESAAQETQKINMSCQFASDHTGMMQYPFCCRDMKPARNNAKANEATDCVQLTVPQLCEDQSRPACCYTIGPKKICTSHVIFQDAEDV